MTLLTLIAIAACVPDNKVAAKKQPGPVLHTSSEWNSALESAYSRSWLRDVSDGTTAFYAECPANGLKNCDLENNSYELKRDNFSKYTSLRHALHTGFSYSDPVTVGAVVLVPDCGKSYLTIVPKYFSHTKWIFMDRVSILKDGKFLFEYKFGNDDVSRDVLPGGVEETGTFSIGGPGPQLDALRQVGTGKILVRLSGENGDALLSARATKHFAVEVAAALAAFDRLTTILTPVTPASCP